MNEYGLISALLIANYILLFYFMVHRRLQKLGVSTFWENGHNLVSWCYHVTAEEGLRPKRYAIKVATLEDDAPTLPTVQKSGRHATTTTDGHINIVHHILMDD